MKIFKRIAGLVLAVSLSGCVTGSSPGNDPQQAFFDRLTNLCGQAFSGRLMSNDAADEGMAGKAMVMHVAACSPTEIKIPFHIETAPGTWDRSRTWIVSRSDAGLRLKHDHRHADGSPDEITLYGGDTTLAGSAQRQSFPVDRESIDMFQNGGLTASVTNIWALEVDNVSQPNARYTYQLSRKNRLFRVEFDLTQPVPAPPLPWGWGRS